MRNFAVIQLLAFWGVVFLFDTGSINTDSFSQVTNCDESPHVYTVEPGDKLSGIGIKFGDIRFWEAIYIANADLIDNPDVIYPGQQLEIPHPIYSFKNSGKRLDAVFNESFCEKETLLLSSINFSRLEFYTKEYLMGNGYGDTITEANTGGEATDNFSGSLSKFRDTFSAVVNSERSDNYTSTNEDSLDTNGRRDAVQQETERRIMMEIDGMVLDETRSKVGRDFFDVFYRNWQSPDKASNFSIRIAEQPSPSLGTIIYVEVNDTETFRMRIQPRYDFIQQAGQYAVRQTYSHLQNNDHRLEIY